MPQRKEPRRIGFDTKKFENDLRRVCAQRRISIARMALEVGVNNSTLSYMFSQGCVPDGINLAALSKWSGLNIGDYSVNLETLELEKENWKHPRRFA